jgi:hypothetical protein
LIQIGRAPGTDARKDQRRAGRQYAHRDQDRGAHRGLHRKAEPAAGRRDDPDSTHSPMLLRDQEHVEIGTERAAHIGQPKIHCV